LNRILPETIFSLISGWHPFKGLVLWTVYAGGTEQAGADA